MLVKSAKSTTTPIQCVHRCSSVLRFGAVVRPRLRVRLRLHQTILCSRGRHLARSALFLRHDAYRPNSEPLCQGHGHCRLDIADLYQHVSDRCRPVRINDRNHPLLAARVRSDLSPVRSYLHAREGMYRCRGNIIKF